MTTPWIGKIVPWEPKRQHWCPRQKPAALPDSSPQPLFACWRRQTNTLQRRFRCPYHQLSPGLAVGVSLKIVSASYSDWLQLTKLRFSEEQDISHQLSGTVCCPTSSMDNQKSFRIIRTSKIVQFSFNYDHIATLTCQREKSSYLDNSQHGGLCRANILGRRVFVGLPRLRA